MTTSYFLKGAMQVFDCFFCISICLEGVYLVPSTGCDFFFAAAVPVWTVLTLSKSRLTSSSASVFHGWFLLLSMCFLLIRIFPSLVWMSYYHCLSSWTCRNETITVTSPRRLRSVVALLFNNIDFWSLWNVSDVLWVWLWRGFSVLEVIISPWVAMTRVLLLPV